MRIIKRMLIGAMLISTIAVTTSFRSADASPRLWAPINSVRTLNLNGCKYEYAFGTFGTTAYAKIRVIYEPVASSCKAAIRVIAARRTYASRQSILYGDWKTSSGWYYSPTTWGQSNVNSAIGFGAEILLGTDTYNHGKANAGYNVTCFN